MAPSREDLRRALGIAQWNVYGISYGSLVGLEYLRRHPESLRSAIDQRKATPAEIAQAAKDCGTWKIMRPYLEALVQNG